MPTAAKRLCAEPNCPEYAVMRGRCHTHMTQEYTRIERWRGSSTARGYDTHWRRVRAQALARDGYVCVQCGARGHVTLAAEVDHIVPLDAGGARLDISNTQSLCKSCHSEKTARENTGRV